MIDIAAAAAVASSLGAAIGIIDKLAGQIESFIEGRRKGKHVPPAGPPSTVIENKGGDLVVSSHGRPTQTVTREQLAQRLSPPDLAYVQALEKSMENHFMVWSAVYPQLALSVDPVAKAKAEAQLRQILIDMRNDLNNLLQFLSRIGVHLDDHYMHIRSLINQA